MKILLLAGLSSFLIAGAVTHAAEPLIKPDDRLAFCGDGMTGGPYIAYIEKYLVACQSIPGLGMKQFGWSAENPSDFLSRLDKDLAPYKPTVVTLLYNFNDDHKPLDLASIDARSTAETKLIDALKKMGVRTIVLGSPPCVDSNNYGNDPAKAAVFNGKLAAVAEADKAVAAKEGVVYADVFGATISAMAKAKSTMGATYNFAGNSIRQPQQACSVAIAYAILKAFALEGDIGTINVSFSSEYIFDKAPEATGDPKILSSTPLTMKVESKHYTFSLPGGHPYPEIALTSLPFCEDLSSLKLIVKGLPGCGARVYWNENSTWHDFTTEELEKGAQLPGNMAWPFGGKIEELDRNINAQLQNDAKAGKAAAAGTPDSVAEADAADQLAQAKARIIPVQYLIRIYPLVTPDKPPTPPVNIVFDTDIAGDVDDVGALALLNDFMCQGECHLLAVNINTRNPDAAATVHAINSYYGHGSIPIGAYHGEAGVGKKMTSILEPAPPEGFHGYGQKDRSHYTATIHQQFDPTFPNSDDLPAGVDVYRKALASAPDGSVTMVSVGIMPNIQDLVQSQPDSVSDLNGLDLIRKKVRELVIMANTTTYDNYLLTKWPTKIKWTTEAGSYVQTGRSLINTPENNPVRVAYSLFGDHPEQHNALKDGRASWDLTASWLAVRGTGDVWAVLAGRQQGINDIMKVPFAVHPNESTITLKMKLGDVAKLIDAELARPPK